MVLLGLQRVGYGWIPLVSSACLLIGIFASYYIAVQEDHVYPILPFISDTGVFHPESCVFGQMLNIASALVALIAYIRYKQVLQYHDGPTDLMEWNYVSATVGYLAAAGMSVVANFQLTPNDGNSLETYTHEAGAAVCFAGAIIYGLTQSWITYTTAADFGSRVLAFVRFTLSIVAIFSAVSLLKFRAISNAEFNGTYAQTWQWNPHDAGYENHVVAAASEYVLALILVILILTLYKELRTITPMDRPMLSQQPEVKGYVAKPRDPVWLEDNTFKG